MVGRICREESSRGLVGVILVTSPRRSALLTVKNSHVTSPRSCDGKNFPDTAPRRDQSFDAKNFLGSDNPSSPRHKYLGAFFISLFDCL